VDMMLQLQGVTKQFGNLEVIRGVDLDIAPGERHAIIGPNGAGKTTLTNLITSRFPPSSGKLLFQGRDITGMAPHKLVRLGIGRSFQIINTFREMTIYENLRNATLARRPTRSSARRGVEGLADAREQAERIMERIGLSHARDRLAGHLPYGEQRVLEIGLVLACDPRLIILDEPAAGLSAAETRHVTALIDEVTQGKTLILIEHDMDVVFSLSNRISVLHYGRILAQGSPEEIRGNEEVKAVYLGYRDDN